MKCLDIDQIYLYLEGELSPEKASAIQTHIARCQKCSQAVQERSFLLDASESLPPMEIPADFAQQTMEMIRPEKDTIWNLFFAAAIGFSSTVLTMFMYLLISGQNPARFFIQLSHTFLSSFKTLSVWLAKSVKLISIAFKVVWQIGSFLLSGISRLTHIMGMEFQIGLVILAFILYISLYFGIRKNILTGERT
ncbi:MAG: zf-HC2 domain-containing protein [Candidatus Aminicenantes bacterium]|nr:zf-HC2 domain-containing protein [Candidatus Aminicenantes bacterium]